MGWTDITYSDKEKKALIQGFDWVSSMILALLTVAFIFTFLFRVVQVDGDSMTNTLQHGDSLLLNSMFYTPERGDIVVINYHDEEPLIKRVIAVGGDRIRIDNETGVVYLNDKPLDEPYVRGGLTPSLGFEEELTVPQGYVFAMGDNRPESKDSRLLGAFSLDEVMGEVICRISPNPGKIDSGSMNYE